MISTQESEITELKVLLASAKNQTSQFLEKDNEAMEEAYQLQGMQLLIAKKVIEEYENASLHCEQKWNQLMEENYLKEEETAALREQLEKNERRWEKVVAEKDREINQLRLKTLKMMPLGSFESQREAGMVLVEQMEKMQEEKLKLISDFNRISAENSDILLDQKRFSLQINHLESLLRPSHSTDSAIEIIDCLQRRIEELLDVIQEQKRINCINELGETKGKVAVLMEKLTHQCILNEELQKRNQE